MNRNWTEVGGEGKEGSRTWKDMKRMGDTHIQIQGAWTILSWTLSHNRFIKNSPLRVKGLFSSPQDEKRRLLFSSSFLSSFFVYLQSLYDSLQFTFTCRCKRNTQWEVQRSGKEMREQNYLRVSLPAVPSSFPGQPKKREEGGEETGSIEGGTRDSCSSCNRKNFAGKRRSILFSVSLVVLLSLVLFLVRRLNLIFTRGSHKKNDWRETERKESSSHSLCSTTYTCSFLFFNTSIFSDFSVVVFMFAPLLLLHQFLELPISSLTTSCFTLWSPLRVLSYFLSFKTQTEGETDRNKQNMRR